MKTVRVTIDDARLLDRRFDLKWHLFDNGIDPSMPMTVVKDPQTNASIYIQTRPGDSTGEAVEPT